MIWSSLLPSSSRHSVSGRFPPGGPIGIPSPMAWQSGCKETLVKPSSLAVPLVAALGMSLLAGTAGASPPRAGAPAAKGFMLPNNVLQVDWDELLPPGTAD